MQRWMQLIKGVAASKGVTGDGWPPIGGFRTAALRCQLAPYSPSAALSADSLLPQPPGGSDLTSANHMKQPFGLWV